MNVCKNCGPVESRICKDMCISCYNKIAAKRRGQSEHDRFNRSSEELHNYRERGYSVQRVQDILLRGLAAP